MALLRMHVECDCSIAITNIRINCLLIVGIFVPNLYNWTQNPSLFILGMLHTIQARTVTRFIFNPRESEEKESQRTFWPQQLTFEGQKGKMGTRSKVRGYNRYQHWEKICDHWDNSVPKQLCSSWFFYVSIHILCRFQCLCVLVIWALTTAVQEKKIHRHDS